MKRSVNLKGMVVTMGLLTMLIGLPGCSGINTPFGNGTGADYPETDEFGEEGDDFSRDGLGEYKKVVGFYFSEGGYSPGYSYYMHADEDDSNVIVLDYESGADSIQEVTCELDEETIEKISQLFAEQNVDSWDKFNRRAKGVLDGSGFSFSADYEDGKHISASGDNCFPKHYGEVVSGISDIMTPVIEAKMNEKREEKYAAGLYSDKLGSAMINYKHRGKSGSDSYSFFILDSSVPDRSMEMTVESVSGEFIEPGTYKFRGHLDNVDDLLASIQEVVEKYRLYKWDGYDKSTDDYNDREWFQLAFSYPEAHISCYGCPDTENYDEVRKELITVVLDFMKDEDVTKED